MTKKNAHPGLVTLDSKIDLDRNDRKIDDLQAMGFHAIEHGDPSDASFEFLEVAITHFEAASDIVSQSYAYAMLRVLTKQFPSPYLGLESGPLEVWWYVRLREQLNQLQGVLAALRAVRNTLRCGSTDPTVAERAPRAAGKDVKN